MDFVASHRLQSLLAAVSVDSIGFSEQALPVMVVMKRLRRLHLPVRCDYQGFFQREESGQRAFMWTTMRGVVNCRFPKQHRLKYAWLEIDATAPNGSTVSIAWDDQKLVVDQPVRGRVTVPIRLSESRTINQARIAIESTTFVPKNCGMGDDTRQLGVALCSLVFAKRQIKYRPRSSSCMAKRLYKLLPRWTRQMNERLLSDHRKAA